MMSRGCRAGFAGLALAVLLVGAWMAALAAARRPAIPRVPDVAVIQTAYADAEAEAQGRHAKDLVIESAECYPLAAGSFMCQVSYTHHAEPSGRVYFDVVTLTGTGAGWTLVSGLCRARTRI